MRERDRSIDIVKGLLVIGMVFGHCLQFFSTFDIFKKGYYVDEFINIITFSGFVFCFGYVSQAAYLSKSYKEVWPKIIKTGLKTLLAYYISGLAFEVFIQNRIVGKGTVLDVVLLKVIPGWSEFIIEFSLFMLIVAVLYKGFKFILEHKVIFFIVTALLFLTTFIPYGQIKNHLLGLLIGTREFPCFPVLQYMPYFLIGMYVKKYSVKFNIFFLAGSFIMTLTSVLSMILKKGPGLVLPERFPPSIFWIMAPALVIYGYYLLGLLLEKLKVPTGVLQSIGSNTIIYLLLSNIIIFALDSKGKLQNQNELWSFFISIVILAMIYFILGVSVKRKPAQSAPQPAAQPSAEPAVQPTVQP